MTRIANVPRLAYYQRMWNNRLAKRCEARSWIETNCMLPGTPGISSLTLLRNPVIINNNGNDPVILGDVLFEDVGPLWDGAVSFGSVWQEANLGAGQKARSTRATWYDIPGTANSQFYSTDSGITGAFEWRLRVWALDADGQQANGYSNVLTNFTAPLTTSPPVIVEAEAPVMITPPTIVED
jgi:hypothetical protein